MATFTLPHISIQASGTLGLGGGNEIWTFGFKVACTQPGTPGVLEIPNQADLVGAASAAVGAVSSLIASDEGGGPFAGLISSWGLFTSVKASAIGPDNHVDTALNTVITDLVTPVRGVANAGDNNNPYAQTPYQVAVVGTLRGTQYTRGPAAYGRFYLPVPNLHADPAGVSAVAMVNGLMAAGVVTKFATAIAVMVGLMNHAAEGSTNVHRVANISTSQVQNQVRWQPVTRVTVDNRPDTIRRRYNKLSGQGQASVNV